jgi:hypothetical protein
VRKKSLRRIEHVAIHSQNNLAIRNVQTFAKVFGIVDIAPEFATFDESFFLL